MGSGSAGGPQGTGAVLRLRTAHQGGCPHHAAAAQARVAPSSIPISRTPDPHSGASSCRQQRSASCPRSAATSMCSTALPALRWTQAGAATACCTTGCTHQTGTASNVCRCRCSPTCLPSDRAHQQLPGSCAAPPAGTTAGEGRAATCCCTSSGTSAQHQLHPTAEEDASIQARGWGTAQPGWRTYRPQASSFVRSAAEHPAAAQQLQPRVLGQSCVVPCVRVSMCIVTVSPV